MPEARFAVVLDDQMSGAAASASSALQDLRSSIQSDTDELRGMQQAMRAMKADASASGAEIAALQAKIDAKKSSIAGATREYVNLGGTFEKLGASAGEGAAGVAALDPTIKKAMGPMGEMVERGQAMISVLGSGGVYLAAALAAVAIVAMTAALVVGVAKMAQFALSASDAARDQVLLLEGMTGSASAAGELAASIASVSSSVALSGDKVQQLGSKLAAAGLRGDQFRKALEAASIAASAGGPEAEAAFMKAATAAAKAGKSVDKLAADVKAKLGPVAAKQMLGFRVQMEKARENATRLFSGVKIEPFLEGLSKVTSLLDENTASGKAVKTIVETMLNPLFEIVGALGPYVGQFFKGMVIGALLTALAVLKVKNVLQEAFGDTSVTEGLDGMKIALYAGAAAAIVIAIGLAVLTVALGALIVLLGIAAVGVALFMLPFIIGFGVIIVAVLAVVAVFALLTYAVMAAYEYVSGLDFGAIASDMMSGLVDGITSGSASVMSALQGLAEQMKATIKGALGISSPSKVFAEFGLNTAAGFEGGIDKGAAGVSDAVSGMVQLPASDGKRADTKGAAGGGDTYYMNVRVDAGSDKGEDIAHAIVRVLRGELEGATIEMGAPLPEPV